MYQAIRCVLGSRLPVPHDSEAGAEGRQNTPYPPANMHDSHTNRHEKFHILVGSIRLESEISA